MRCPEENTWLRYLGGDLEEPGLGELEDHLDDCASCRVVFADLARSTAHSGERRTVPLVLAHAEPLARGTLVGRYVILSLLGRGGMGVVYKAFDPELDRAIALKLVGLAGNAHARARLVREAKTLARVSHPNVVAVHDVGTHDDDVFVAMELCDGATLRAWLAERARPARDVLAVMLAAGAGLAAAHELGIVHRDFKPENVIVGNDGRVRVLDFGLARSVVRVASLALPAASESLPHLTRDGMLVGTPAYMAPEQDAGRPIDARSDQFSFCAVLYEALYGQRAFAGERYDEIAAQRQAGAVRPPPTVAGVSSRVKRAVLRGLRVDPAERYPAMPALLVELGARRWSTRTRLALGALVVGSLAAGGWATWVATHAPPSPEETCATAAAGVGEAWNPVRHAELVRAFTAAGGAAAAPRIAARFDAWSAGWAAQRRALCEETLRSERGDTARTADRLQCLRRRLQYFDAIVSVCTHAATPAIVEAADRITDELPAPASCNARETTTVSDQARTSMQPFLHDVVAGQFALAAGDVAEVERRATSAIAAARAHHQGEPLALLLLGRAQVIRGSFDAARATLLDAVRAATRENEDNLVVEAWLEIIGMTFRSGRLDVQLDDAIFSAEVAAQRLPADDPLHARLAYQIGSVRVMDGEVAAAQPLLERAVKLWTAADATKHRLDIAGADNSLGMIHMARAQWAEADRSFRRALAAWETITPPHVNVGITLGALADGELMQHHFAAAAPLAERAIAALEAAGPTGKTSLAPALLRLAELDARTGHCDRVAAPLDRARELAVELHGRTSAMFGVTLLVSGLCELARGRTRAAVAQLEEARTLAADHPINILQRPATELALARALAGSDRRRARELAESALSGFSQHPGTQADRADAEAWLAAH